MGTILREAAALVLLAPALALGALWVRRAWRSGDPHTCLALGSVAGASAYLVALNLLSYLAPPGQAAWALFAVGLLGLAWAGRGGLSGWRWEGSDTGAPRELRLVWAALAPVALLWFVYAFADGGTDQLNHSAICGVLSARGLPMPNPYEPGEVLAYHYGADLLGVAWSQAVGLPAWWGMNVWLALLRVLVLAAAVEFLRACAAREDRRAGAAELILGALAFALGGSFAWSEWLSGRCGFLETERQGFSCEGLAYHGIQPALAAGWAWLLAVLAACLRWPAPEPGREVKEALTLPSPARGEGGTTALSPALPLGMMLAASALLAEHSALLIGAALLTWTVLRIAGRRRAEERAALPPWPDWIQAGAFGVLVAAFQGGVLTCLVLRITETQPFGLHWTGTFWPTFPGMKDRFSPGDPSYWTTTWREYGPVFWAAPLLAAWAFRPRSRAPLAARILLAVGLPAFLWALYVDIGLNHFDQFRFAQVYLSAALLALGLVLAPFWDRVRDREGVAGQSFLNWGNRTWKIPLALPRAFVIMAMAVLCLQGVRFTVGGVLTLAPEQPFRHPDGQAAALREVAARGQAGEGIVASILGFPPTPGILGRPVACSAPGTNLWDVRSPAWRAALAAPSPLNLRGARARWVCLAGAELARAAPFLEGLDTFEIHGVFGVEWPYRLYRYAGPWEIPEDGFSNLRNAERFPIAALRLGAAELPATATAQLQDGVPASAVGFEPDALSRTGLAALFAEPQKVSMVWLAVAGEATLLDRDADIALAALGPDGRPKPIAAPRLLRSPGRPAALAIRFEPVQTPGLVLWITRRQPVQPGARILLGEWWIGAAEE